MARQGKGEATPAVPSQGDRGVFASDGPLAGIHQRLVALEGAAELFVETNYCARATAQDELEFGVLHPIEGLRQSGIGSPTSPSGIEPDDPDSLDALTLRAGALRRRLEEVDARLLKHLREQIRQGIRGSSLRDILDRQVVGRHHLGNSPGYDGLDGFVADLILSTPAPGAALDREPEMVFYQPTPARIVLDMVDTGVAGPGDLFIDVGSGLGLVPILMNLLTGTRAVGIEIDPAYHRYAAGRAADLELTEVGFVNADARKADYRGGTVFFLYTPFTGQLLQDVLGRINLQREHRPITLFSFGPCTDAVALEAWLRPVGEVDDPHSLAMFRAV